MTILLKHIFYVSIYVCIWYVVSSVTAMSVDRARAVGPVMIIGLKCSYQ